MTSLLEIKKWSAIMDALCPTWRKFVLPPCLTMIVLEYIPVPDNWECKRQGHEISYMAYLTLCGDQINDNDPDPDIYENTVSELILTAHVKYSHALEYNYLTGETRENCYSDCEGWTIGDRRCECGGYKTYKWVRPEEDSVYNTNHKYNQYLPEYYSLFSKIPLGEVEHI